MFLKEVLAILAFSSSTLAIAGFAIKVDKFEHNYLIANKLNLSLKSYRKLNLKKGNNFYYFEEDSSKLAKVTDIQVMRMGDSREKEYIQLSLDPKRNYQTNWKSTKAVKYSLGSKPFWINLLS